MEQAARCPKCGTSFRIVPDQLKISEGWVRCGHCSFVFNAYETQYEIPEAALEILLKKQQANSISADTLLPDPAASRLHSTQFSPTTSSIFTSSRLSQPLTTPSPLSAQTEIPVETKDQEEFRDSLLSELHIGWTETHTTEEQVTDIPSAISSPLPWEQGINLEKELALDELTTSKQITFPESQIWDDPGDNLTRSNLPPQARLPGLSTYKPRPNPVAKPATRQPTNTLPENEKPIFSPSAIPAPSTFKTSTFSTLPTAFQPSTNHTQFQSSRLKNINTTELSDSFFTANTVPATSSKKEIPATLQKTNSAFINTSLKPLAPSFSQASNKSIFAETKPQPAPPTSIDDFSFTSLADNNDDDLDDEDLIDDNDDFEQEEKYPEFSDSLPLILAVSSEFNPENAKKTPEPISPRELEERLYPSHQPKKKTLPKGPSVFEQSKPFQTSQRPNEQKRKAKTTAPATAHTPAQQKPTTTKSAPKTPRTSARSGQPVANPSTPILIDSNLANSKQSKIPSELPESQIPTSSSTTYHKNTASKTQNWETPELDEDELSFIRDADQSGFWNSPALNKVGAAFSILFSLLLVLQFAIIFKDQIALKFPVLKPALVAICAPFNCTVDFPRNINAIVIYDSKFQDTGDGRSYQFYLFIRNQSNQPVAIPSIELTLKNNFDQILIRKTFSPEELGVSQLALQAGEELLIDNHLLISADDIRGFNVSLFYP